MKAKVLMLALMGSFALAASAQAQQTEAPKTSGHKTAFAVDNACDHWFMEIQGGVGMLPFGKANNQAQIADRIYPMVQLGLGQWHTPWFATRLQAEGWNMRSFVENPMDAKAPTAYNNIFALGHLNFMFDVVNYFAPYKANRVFHLVPFVGMGASYKYATLTGNAKAYTGDITKDANKVAVYGKNNISGSVNAGLVFKFRLGRRVDLNIEAQMVATPASFAQATYAEGADVMAFATAGLGFNLGKPEWDVVTPMDWGLVNDLNGQINNLRAENAELAKRPVSCPECPEVAPVTTPTIKHVVNNVVFFRLGSDKIDQNQFINIYNTAKFALDKNCKVTVVGYADEGTGSAEFNMGISERRANAVAKALIEKYGVPADMVEVEFKGSSVQPYETNDWNRVVIMTAAE